MRGDRFEARQYPLFRGRVASSTPAEVQSVEAGHDSQTMYVSLRVAAKVERGQTHPATLVVPEESVIADASGQGVQPVTQALER